MNVYMLLLDFDESILSDRTDRGAPRHLSMRPMTFYWNSLGQFNGKAKSMVFRGLRAASEAQQARYQLEGKRKGYRWDNVRVLVVGLRVGCSDAWYSNTTE